jgi:CubicO group peptidase (beta-lactamase class C family)
MTKRAEFFMSMTAWIDATQASLPAWLESARTPGAAVALLDRDQEPRTVCSGVQDLDSQRPVTPETVFEAASLGKPVFACLALQLASEGQLDLETPLSDYLVDPWVPDEPRLPLITARKVLSHSSGLPNWLNDNMPRALLFSPGAHFGYSGEGFLYLQRVVEKITGQPLDTLAQRRLFDPLGMQRSRFICPDELVGGIAQGHDREGRPLPKWKPWANAGTSLHTSLADYARFLQHMLTGGVANMLPWQTPIDADTAWGLGWGLKRISNDLIFWQWGDNGGWKHLAAASVGQGKGVLVLTNGEGGFQVWKEVLHCTLDGQDTIFTWLSGLH